MPMTLMGLQALSVEMPITASTRELAAMVARTSASAPMTFVRTASTGKYSHVGTCFSAAAWMTMSVSRSDLDERLVVADVADPELEHVACLLVDHVVSGRAAVKEPQAHVVLLGLVTREHGHARRPTEAAVEQPAHDTMPEGARASGHHNPLVVYRQRCVLVS